ncbi:MAG TPA: sigma-70 family RNA polymerase sigma factor [Planctomycetaceae bacterium]|nr:sigma-70 family RNA polymerase sigma factor [Planctomycetaceae bacterium]
MSPFRHPILPATSLNLLLRLRQSSDQQAWERFVDLYTPLMYRWALQAGAQPADAADLVQDVLVSLLRVLPTFEYDRQKSFRAWLRTVLTNKWRESWRHKLLPTAGGDALAHVVEPAPGVAWSDAQEQAALCRQALELIRPEFSAATWGAFMATFFDGRPVSDICQTHALTPNAVYLARGRVLARLREELDGVWE